MSVSITLIGYAIIIGVGATLFMDLYALINKRLFKIPSLDYAIVGRWIGHFKEGKFVHQNILLASPISGERVIGWCAHYLIGITFALLLLLVTGIEWVVQPTFVPAFLVGLLTTVAPFFLMQPAFGFGIAASKTPRPTIARVRSLMTHTIYGVGLYIAGIVLSALV
ncbi:MAG: DUF2938 domain-containing protein [Flavobacteriaceae bacterium]|jgi:hypothetical protein|nr:DUF2938 domain-containing protein [Flavobacteriaceae bacterium]